MTVASKSDTRTNDMKVKNCNISKNSSLLLIVDVDVVGGFVLQKRVFRVIHTVQIVVLVLIRRTRSVVLQHMSRPTASLGARKGDNLRTLLVLLIIVKI